MRVAELSYELLIGTTMSDDKESALIQLVYASAATVEFSNDDLDQLLERARANNTTLSVTGMLLYTDRTFFQVLEGAPDVVQTLYEKIELDSRHDNVLMLSKEKVEERNFGDWRMGFLRDREEIQHLPGFIDFFDSPNRTFVDLEGDSKRIRQIIEGFRRGRWRRQSTSGK